LDVGCAGGKYAGQMIRRGFRVTGIDLVEEFISIAHKRLPQGRFLKMDLRRLRFPPANFGGIWANAVLLHVTKKDLPLVLRGFYRVLKTGGTISLRTRLGKGRGYKKEKIVGNASRLFVYYTKSELERAVVRAGYTVLRSPKAPDDLGRKSLAWVTIFAKK
jgi:2-polyprenyl-3-methyl-5-hydroxy-6-metoxy-1,4-benzoquinol methylase